MKLCLSSHFVVDIKAELLEKETLQQQMYFEMFQKGRDSATFEFADEVSVRWH